jgi:NAD(P)-dependent dehydrogenase (short-subunit alcohol dehydrogenase family)
MGVYLGLKHGPKYMNDGGAIINTASLGASLVFPGSGPYSASKAAVSNYTTMACAELASRGIRVNAVAPSFIRTPLAMDDIELFEKIGRRATNALRIAEPDEVAAVYHFLASDDASYINGQVINVDGGMSIGFTEAMVEMITDS